MSSSPSLNAPLAGYGGPRCPVCACPLARPGYCSAYCEREAAATARPACTCGPSMRPGAYDPDCPLDGWTDEPTYTVTTVDAGDTWYLVNANAQGCAWSTSDLRALHLSAAQVAAINFGPYVKPTLVPDHG